MIWRVAVPLARRRLVALAAGARASGLPPHAWYYFAIFVAVILALITEPLPPSAVGFIGVTVMAVAGLPFSARRSARLPAFRLPAESVRWALAGFSNGTVWLIFAAFVFAMGYEKTAARPPHRALSGEAAGPPTLGLGYAIALSDLLLAPFTPVEYGAQRRHDLPGHPQHPGAVRRRQPASRPGDSART